MLINNKKLSVCPITTHIDIKQVSNKFTKILYSKKFQGLIFGLRKNLKGNQNVDLSFEILGIKICNQFIKFSINML